MRAFFFLLLCHQSTVCHLGYDCCFCHLHGWHLLIFNYVYRRASDKCGIYTPLTRTSIRTMERMIARAPHVQSSDHLITRAILSHYLTTLAFVLQHSHTGVILDITRLHRTMVALHRANFERILFHMRLFRQQFTIHV